MAPDSLHDKPSQARWGLCQLTKTEGPLARSHIVPDAFMRRLTEAPFREWDGAGHSPKRYTGWYDQRLLSPEAEALVARYDSVAAEALLRGRWTYRRRRDSQDPSFLSDTFVPHRIYEIGGVDTDAMKLFGLSLLWRAAASGLEAFRDVRLRAEFLEHLRIRVLKGVAGKPSDIPMYFALFDSSEELTKIAPTKISGHPFYRFFLDGVVCYVAHGRTNIWSKRIPQLLVGSTLGRVAAVCVPSAGSAHAEYVSGMANALADTHGDVFAGEYERPYLKR